MAAASTSTNVGASDNDILPETTTSNPASDADAIPHRSRLFLVRGCFLATGTHWLPIAKPPKQRIWLLPSTLVHVNEGLTSYYAFLGLVWLHGIPIKTGV